MQPGGQKYGFGFLVYRKIVVASVIAGGFIAFFLFLYAGMAIHEWLKTPEDRLRELSRVIRGAGIAIPQLGGTVARADTSWERESMHYSFSLGNPLTREVANLLESEPKGSFTVTWFKEEPHITLAQAKIPFTQVKPGMRNERINRSGAEMGISVKVANGEVKCSRAVYEKLAAQYGHGPMTIVWSK